MPDVQSAVPYIKSAVRTIIERTKLNCFVTYVSYQKEHPNSVKRGKDVAVHFESILHAIFHNKGLDIWTDWFYGLFDFAALLFIEDHKFPEIGFANTQVNQGLEQLWLKVLYVCFMYMDRYIA